MFRILVNNFGLPILFQVFSEITAFASVLPYAIGITAVALSRHSFGGGFFLVLALVDVEVSALTSEVPEPA